MDARSHGRRELGLPMARRFFFSLGCGVLMLSVVTMLDGCAKPGWDGTTWNNNSPSSNPSGVTHLTYHSAIMNVDIGYNIYLPPQYATQPTQRFPVIYFLHGIGGNENSNPSITAALDSMIRVGTVKPMIVVFPNGGLNSKYMDAQPGTPAYGSYMVESTIIKELIPYVDSNYRTIERQQGRAVQRFSMGGGGCERFGFKFPQLFSSIFCFAPAIDQIASNVLTKDPALMANLYNNNTSLFQNNSVWGLSTGNAVNINGLPIHVVVGSADSLLSGNQQMDRQLTSLGIAHDPLQIISGIGHDLGRLTSNIGNDNFNFAASYFP
jgi:S-formylglutathione hydrolase FrmB